MHSVVRDWHSAPLADADLALCHFAAKLTHDQHLSCPDDLDQLRRVGFDDAAIHDATQVVGYFSYISRVADALGVEPESFIREWGAVS